MNLPDKYFAWSPCFMLYFILYGAAGFLLKQFMGGKRGYRSQTPKVSIIFERTECLNSGFEMLLQSAFWNCWWWWAQPQQTAAVGGGLPTVTLTRQVWLHWFMPRIAAECSTNTELHHQKSQGLGSYFYAITDPYWLLDCKDEGAGLCWKSKEMDQTHNTDATKHVPGSCLWRDHPASELTCRNATQNCDLPITAEHYWWLELSLILLFAVLSMFEFSPQMCL